MLRTGLAMSAPKGQPFPTGLNAATLTPIYVSLPGGTLGLFAHVQDLPPTKFPEGVVVARDGNMPDFVQASFLYTAMPFNAFTRLKMMTTFTVLFGPDGHLVTDSLNEVTAKYVWLRPNVAPAAAQPKDILADDPFCSVDFNNANMPSTRIFDPLDASYELARPAAIACPRAVRMLDVKAFADTGYAQSYLDNNTQLLLIAPYVGGLLRSQ